MRRRSFEQIQAAVARNVQARRRTLRLSQEKLALKAEVDRTFVSQVERALANPSLRTLTKLAEVLETDVVHLLA